MEGGGTVTRGHITETTLNTAAEENGEATPSEED